MDFTSARRLAELVGDLPSDRPPLYAALAGRVQLMVADGRLAVGTRLPAERELAAAVGISRVTVAAAYARLREHGWAVTRHGSGTRTALPSTSSPAAWVAGEVPHGVVDLAHAAPSAPPEVAVALGAALAELPRYLPGHGYHPSGLPDLRARLAERYTRRGLPTSPEHVLITSGALHAIALALRVLARRGDQVIIEHPTYPNALDTARSRGLRPVPVAVPRDDPERFVDDVLATAAQVDAPVAYLIPDFQNPTGQLLDGSTRTRLAAGLRRAGTVALVDESVVELGLDVGTPEPFALADPNRVVTVGSLSKPVWGGLRVGWLRAHPDVVARLGTAEAMRSDMAGPVLEQLAACHLLDGALDAMLPRRRAELRHQRDILRRALAAHVPEWEVPEPAGGLMLWCRLPSTGSSALTTAAAEQGLRLAAGPRFGTGHAFDDHLRLPFTQPAEVLTAAVPVLARCWAGTRSRRAPRLTNPAPVF